MSTSSKSLLLLFLIFTARKRSLRRLCFYRCLSVHGGGVHGCSGEGHAWLLWGGMCGCSGWGGHGCSQGACVVTPGGHAWLLRGVCMVAPRGGVHGCSWGGHAWLLRGACMVALGGHVWLLLGGCVVAPGGHAWLLPGGACVVAPRGGMRGCSGGHAWLLGGVHGCSWGGMRGFFDEIRSMSGRYASYWNAFLLKLYLSLPWEKLYIVRNW